MKTAFLAIPIVLVFSLLASSQQVIENPEKPLAKNAGRVLELKEVLKILDGGTDQYYFKYPRNLCIAPDESIFVQDENQILQFDKTGRFLRNYFKKGQGPGEMNYAGNIVFTDKNIIIQDSYLKKILWFDYGGRFIKDLTIRQISGSILRLILFLNNVYYFDEWEFPSVKGEPDYIDVLDSILAISDSAEEIKSLMSFTVKKYVIPSSHGGGGFFDIGRFMAISHQNRYLVISHTSEYLLKIYDPTRNQIVRTFKRAYERAKPPPEIDESKKSGFIVKGKRFTAPEQKYLNDVANIFAQKDEIWIATSTDDKNKGQLIDVFNFEGIYIDSFYFKPPEKTKINFTQTDGCAVSGDFLYTIDKNEDGTYAIKKYQIGG